MGTPNTNSEWEEIKQDAKTELQKFWHRVLPWILGIGIPLMIVILLAVFWRDFRIALYKTLVILFILGVIALYLYSKYTDMMERQRLAKIKWEREEEEKRIAFRERNSKPTVPTFSITPPPVEGESTTSFDKSLDKMTGGEILVWLGDFNCNILPQWRAWHAAWEREGRRRLESELRKYSVDELRLWFDRYGDAILAYSCNQSSKSTEYWTNDLPDGLELDWNIWLSPYSEKVKAEREYAALMDERRNLLHQIVKDGQDVCWKCATIEPIRCEHCGCCMSGCYNRDEYNPRYCKGCTAINYCGDPTCNGYCSICDDDDDYDSQDPWQC